MDIVLLALGLPLLLQIIAFGRLSLGRWGSTRLRSCRPHSGVTWRGILNRMSQAAGETSQTLKGHKRQLWTARNLSRRYAGDGDEGTRWHFVLDVWSVDRFKCGEAGDREKISSKRDEIRLVMLPRLNRDPAPYGIV